MSFLTKSIERQRPEMLCDPQAKLLKGILKIEPPENAEGDFHILHEYALVYQHPKSSSVIDEAEYENILAMVGHQAPPTALMVRMSNVPMPCAAADVGAFATSARSKSDRRSPKDRWRNLMFPLDI